MLRIDTEFRKGILFVRLNGKISNDNYLASINNLIENIGIRYIVLNIENLRGCKVNSYQALDISKLLGIIIKD